MYMEMYNSFSNRLFQSINSGKAHEQRIAHVTNTMNSNLVSSRKYIAVSHTITPNRKEGFTFINTPHNTPQV